MKACISTSTGLTLIVIHPSILESYNHSFFPPFPYKPESISPSLILSSIPPSISGLFANQTPSVLPSPTCQEQLPAALLTTLLTTLPHLPRPAARHLNQADVASEGHRLLYGRTRPQTTGSVVCETTHV